MSEVITKTLSGPIHVWNYNNHTRTYGEITMPFSEANRLFRVSVYSAQTGRGEQRSLIDSHVKLLDRNMEAGTYTPTPLSVGLRKKHRDAVQVEHGKFTLNVASDEPLPVTDGQHRLGALERKLKFLKDRLKAEKDDAEKEIIKERIAEIESLPITALVYLDGDVQEDFINLQQGRPVDKSQLFSLKIQHKTMKDPEFRLGFDTAKLLNTNNESPFKNLVKFDSRGAAPLPITTVCAKSSSDQSTSLVGLAKVGLTNSPSLTPEQLSNVVITAFTALQKNAESVLESGKALAYIGNGGNKGSSTMMLGVSICLAYEMLQRGETHPSEELINQFVAAAKTSLDGLVTGGFSSVNKRQIMLNFAREFFTSSKEEKYEGLPVGLLKILSPSAFGLPPFPKAPKAEVQAEKTEESTETTPTVSA